MKAKGCLVLFVGLALLILLGSTMNGGGGKTSSATEVRSTEAMLAIIQKQGYLADSDPLVGQFKRQLDLLEPKCKDTRSRLADMTVATHDIMAKAGVEETHLSILTNVTASIPDSGPQWNCADIFAAYATLRAPR